MIITFNSLSDMFRLALMVWLIPTVAAFGLAFMFLLGGLCVSAIESIYQKICTFFKGK